MTPELLAHRVSLAIRGRLALQARREQLDQRTQTAPPPRPDLSGRPAFRTFPVVPSRPDRPARLASPNDSDPLAFVARQDLARLRRSAPPTETQ